MLPYKMDTKRGLTNVLTTTDWLKTKEIDAKLQKIGLVKSRSTIRHMLANMVHVGMADSRKTNDRYNRKEWTLTQKGIAFSMTPCPVKAPKTPRTKKAVGTNQGSKGSPARTTTMCIDASKPTLNVAIEALVVMKAASTQPFSAHDITKSLREKVLLEAAGSLGGIYIDKDETGVVHVRDRAQTFEVPKIDHDYVRDVVHELFHQGKMPSYARHHTGKHWEYEFTTPAVLVVVPNSDPATDPATDPAPVAADGSTYDGTPTL